MIDYKNALKGNMNDKAKNKQQSEQNRTKTEETKIGWSYSTFLTAERIAIRRM
jgi:hypothetical protein